MSIARTYAKSSAHDLMHMAAAHQLNMHEERMRVVKVLVRFVFRKENARMDLMVSSRKSRIDRFVRFMSNYLNNVYLYLCFIGKPLIKPVRRVSASKDNTEADSLLYRKNSQE